MILSTEYFIAKEQIKNNVLSLPLQAHHLTFFGTTVFGDEFPNVGELKKAIQIMQLLNDEYFDKNEISDFSDLSMIIFKGKEISSEKYESFIFNHEKISNQEKVFILTNKYVENVITELKNQVLSRTNDFYYVFDDQFDFIDIYEKEDGLKAALSSKYFVFKKESETTPDIPLFNKAGRKIDWAKLFLKNINNENIDRVFFYNFVLGFNSHIIDDFFTDDYKYQDVLDFLEDKYEKTDTQWAYYFQDNRSRKNLALPSIVREMEALKIDGNIINTFILYVIFDQRANRKTITNIDLFEGAMT